MVHKSVGIEGNLVGIGRNPYIGSEYLSKVKLHENVKIYFSKDKESVRLIYHIGRKHISCIQISFYETPVIMNMYTLPKYRRKGYLTVLHKITKLIYKNVKFSSTLSADGKLFVNSLK